MKIELPFTRVLDGSFARNLDADAPRTARPLGAAIRPARTARPLVVTSGVGLGSAHPGDLATEDHLDPSHANPRKVSEVAGAEIAARGVNISGGRSKRVLRLDVDARRDGSAGVGRDHAEEVGWKPVGPRLIEDLEHLER